MRSTLFLSLMPCFKIFTAIYFLKSSFWNLKVKPTLMHMVCNSQIFLFYFFNFSFLFKLQIYTNLPRAQTCKFHIFLIDRVHLIMVPSTACPYSLCLLCWITPWPSRTRKQAWGSAQLPHPRLLKLPARLSLRHHGCCPICLDGSFCHMLPTYAVHSAPGYFRSTLITMLRSK